jgi:hypothetical protein
MGEGETEETPAAEAETPEKTGTEEADAAADAIAALSLAPDGKKEEAA